MYRLTISLFVLISIGGLLAGCRLLEMEPGDPVTLTPAPTETATEEALVTETAPAAGTPPATSGGTATVESQPTPTLVTNYSIYPFVVLIEPGFEWVLEAAEVDVILEFRLRDIRDGYARRRLIRRGVPFRTDTYQVGEQMIWGATARMVADLLERVDELIEPKKGV